MSKEPTVTMSLDLRNDIYNFLDDLGYLPANSRVRELSEDCWSLAMYLRDRLHKEMSRPVIDKIPALICAAHPIMRDELCATCWEAKDRNDRILNSTDHPIQPKP